MKDFKCPQCGLEGDIENVVSEKIPLPDGKYHLKISCQSCGRFIKFQSHEKPTLYFGKHRGKTIEDVARIDRRYLVWLSEQELKGRLLEQIKLVLS